MSIWCSSFEVVGFDYDEAFGEPVPGTPIGGQVRSYATGFSNHFPTTDGQVEKPAHIDLSYIPVWCVPGHFDETDDRMGPWLRLMVLSEEHDYFTTKATGKPSLAAVVIDPDAARALATALLRWADSDLAHPKEPTP